MAFRQGSGGAIQGASGVDHTPLRSSRLHEIDVEIASSSSGSGGSSATNIGASGGAASSSSRAGDLKAARGKKGLRGKNSRQCSAGWYLFILLCVVGFTFLGSDFIGRALVVPGEEGSRDWFSDPFPFSETHSTRGGNKNQKRKLVGPELRFGQGIRGLEGDNRDSRDWDTDDRNRDIEGNFEQEYAKLQQEFQESRKQRNEGSEFEFDSGEDQVPGLSYERNRKELTKYEKKYEDDLRRDSNGTEGESDGDDESYDEYEPEPEVVRHGSRAGKSMPVPEVVAEKPKPRRSHRRGPCEINFGNSSRVPEQWNSSRFAQFTLKYVAREEKPAGFESLSWKPRFEGHPSLKDRERSFHAANQTIHCGFVQGPDSSPSTGFDISLRDKEFMSTCKVAVSSCIFGKSDQLHSPRRRKMSSSSKKEVCFVLFVDQPSLDVMVQEGHIPDDNGFIGLWRVVLVKNLPYTDLRLVGKIPKFLSHRLFPASRFSVWLDSKLRLQSDPLSILDYFLWKRNLEYGISNHYDRHCVWDEVQQNKRLNKFNHSLIDEQFLFYQRDGLTRFNASDPNRLLPSNVPEGSFIVRAHTPMSNLFSCAWFNEVARFTPRDQLSFAYVHMKVVKSNPDTRFRLGMFKDCERKMIAKLYRHRQQAVQ